LEDETMNVKEFLESTFDPYNEYQVRPRVRCADGFSISIQGGTRFNYCTPREHVNEYQSLELGFPSHGEPELMEYAEEPRKCRRTVYGYVPLATVEVVIARHGGISGTMLKSQKRRLTWTT
jgi:hypothetical protein